MRLHAFRLALAATALALMAACSTSGEELESIDSAAQAACDARHVEAGPAMETCLIEMRENIRAARAYRPERQQAPPPSNVRRPASQPH